MPEAMVGASRRWRLEGDQRRPGESLTDYRGTHPDALVERP